MLYEAIAAIQVMSMIIRTYSELIRLPTFKERYRYLRIGGAIGENTFGAERYLNQAFYRSKEWRKVRDEVIVRDNGCDLAFENYDIFDQVIVHHMNPITVDDIEEFSDNLINPEFLICVSEFTHKAIHFGNEHLLPRPVVERRPGDTKLW